MKRKRIILFAILAAGVMVIIFLLINTKQCPITDYSESSYIYEENDSEAEIYENTKDFAPVEKDDYHQEMKEAEKMQEILEEELGNLQEEYENSQKEQERLQKQVEDLENSDS